MRDKKTTLICLSILIIQSVTYAQSKYNLDFDNFDSKNEVLPEGWFKWGHYKNLNGEHVYGERIGDGNIVGRVMSDKKDKFGCITYRIPANYVGDTIRLTGRIKHEKVKGYVGLLMRIDGDKSTGSLAFKSMQSLKIKGTHDWSDYSIQIPFPVGAENIYVGGILGGKGTAWFDDFKISIDGKDIEAIKETPKIYVEDYDPDKLNSALRKSSQPIDLSDDDRLITSLNPLIERLGNKKIVSIGESTHGTSEFYRLREIITKRLIEEKGFNLVVLENPYDDIELLNNELPVKPLDSLIQKHLFSIYQTKEVKSFLQWYKDNRKRYNVDFKGCDDSYWVFYEVLTTALRESNDKKLNKLLDELESNISRSDIDNSKKQLKISASIYDTLLAIETHLKSTNKLTEPLKEILFNGKNSYINYTNIKNKKPIQSRDEIMADRISYFAKDKSNKIIVWAHNAHISNEIIVDNEIGLMGRDLKQEFGNDYHSIGLTTLKGSYSFINEKFINTDHFYKDKLKKADIQSIENPLWENSFALNGSTFYLDFSALKKGLKTDEIIGSTRLIGYGKETTKDIYRLPLVKYFDSLIFIENTNATIPLFD